MNSVNGTHRRLLAATPQDAPGMDLGKGEPYDVLLFSNDGRYKVYQHYGPTRP